MARGEPSVPASRRQSAFAILTSRLASQRTRYLLGAVIILIGVVRIVLTYPSISQTIDESSHIATGIEWLDQGKYTLNQENPPLARIAVALGPYLSGAVAGNTPAERVQVLAGNAPYPQTLYLARLGILLFFVAASLMVWGLGSRLHDPTVGLLALTIFTLTPVILAHSGVATTDMAVTACYCGVILAFVYWVEDPSFRRSALLGLAFGLVVLAKYSSMLFLGASAAAVLAARLIFVGDRIPVMGTVRRFRTPVVVALATAALVVWGGFRFSVGQVHSDAATRPIKFIDDLVGQTGTLHDLAYRAMAAPVFPAPELLAGIGQMIAHHRDSHTTYFLGETRERGGFALFFPVAFLVKTPIPLIILAVVGAAAAFGAAIRYRRWTVLIPTMGAAAVMVSVIPSGVNVGLRHILPFFSLLSISAAVGVSWIVNSRHWERASVRLATTVFLAWFLLNSVMSHPDYLSFFNGFGGSNPEEIFADSDLDWGQGVGRLAEELRKRDIKQVHLGLFTRARLDRFDWPTKTETLEAGVPTTGWIAASIFHIKVSRNFAWLEAHKPVDTVAKSIRLYHISENGKDEARRPAGDSQ